MLNVKELIPWRSEKRGMQERHEGADAVGALQANINHAFESFWRNLDLPLPGAWGMDSKNVLPNVDIGETEKAVEIKAELPGLEPKDVEVTLGDGAVTIRGQKKAEREAMEKDYVLRERSFGTVERTVPLPDGLNLDAAEAVFKNGVLTLTIAKTPEAQAAVRRIPVKHS
jgi:HSP20 family protein